MAVGCYLAAFKKDERGPLLLGFSHENEVKARAAEVLGVAPESVKNWMQEFIPYWSKSARRDAFPGWLPSDLTGRPREVGQTRESRDRMFADFELKPEQELVEMCKAILDISYDPKFDRVFFDRLAEPYLDKSEKQTVFSSSEVAERAAANELPVVDKKPVGNSKPEKRRAGVAGLCLLGILRSSAGPFSAPKATASCALIPVRSLPQRVGDSLRCIMLPRFIRVVRIPLITSQRFVPTVTGLVIYLPKKSSCAFGLSHVYPVDL